MDAASGLIRAVPDCARSVPSGAEQPTVGQPAVGVPAGTGSSGATSRPVPTVRMLCSVPTRTQRRSAATTSTALAASATQPRIGDSPDGPRPSILLSCDD